MDWHRETSHEGKVDYKSMETAIKATVRMEEKTGRKFDAYQCEHCEGFHIGKSLSGFSFVIDLSSIFGCKVTRDE